MLTALGAMALFLSAAQGAVETNYLDGARDFRELTRRVEERSPDFVRRDQNGAVEFIALGAVTDDNLALISREPSIKEISFIGTRVTETGFAALQRMTNLSSLGVCLGGPRSNFVELVSGLSQLRRLSLVATRLQPSDLPYLLRMTNLERLEMPSDGMSGSTVISLWTNQSHLIVTTTNSLDGVHNFPELVQRVEKRCSTCVKRDKDGAVESIGEMEMTDDEIGLISLGPSVRELNCIWPKFSEQGMNILGQMTNLISLVIVRTNALPTVSKLTQLRRLHFSCSRFKPADLPYLIMLTNLEDLEIRGAWEMGAHSISAMTNFPRLKKLTIGGGGEYCTETIADFRTNGYEIGTNWDGWRKPETSELMALTNLTSLEELQIVNFVDFGDEQLRKLASCPNLKSLVLTETKVSDNWTNIASQFPALTNAEASRFINGEGRKEQKWTRKE